ncbi:MAG TPA: type II secretion system F family protein [Acidothermaceae bacterium]|jgi:tight adherence protein C|nr:type II secretion system F family protein [Acidothermaceae bacterium]
MSQSTLLTLGVVAIFVGIAGAIVSLGVAASQRQQVSRSLAALDALGPRPEQVRRELDRPFSERVVNPLVARLGRLGNRFSPRDESARIRHKLELAGSPIKWDVERIQAFKMLGLIGGAAVGIAFPLLFGAGVAVTMGVAIVLTPLGYFIPDITLYQVAYNRNERIRRDLPDSMDLLTISVEAGLPFDSALSQVARNTHGPLADELFRVLQEMQIGLGRIEALRALAERTNVVELRGFVTAMVQADQFGIPIASVLRVQSRDMRVKRTQRAEEQAQKVPVKILFPLVFCILPALFIVVMGPAAISAYHNLLH